MWRTVHLPGLLAHSFVPGRYEFDWVMRELTPGSDVLMVLGEIDCRRQLLKRAKKLGRPPREIAVDLVARYGASLALMASRYRIAVWGPHVALKDDGFPYEARRTVTLNFNGLLCQWCAEHDVKFFSMAERLVTMTREDALPYFYSDESHLGIKARELAPLDAIMRHFELTKSGQLST